MGRSKVETAADLTWDWWEEGRLVRQELDKQILSSACGWVRIAYLYRDLARAAGLWKEPRVGIVLYRREKGIFRRKGPACNLNPRQYYVIMRTAEDWLRRADGVDEQGKPNGELQLAPPTGIPDPSSRECPEEYLPKPEEESTRTPPGGQPQATG